MFVDEKLQGELQGVKPDLRTLRVDRLLALAEEIERPSRGWGFDMSRWPYRTYMGGECGTPACIAGHAEAMYLCDPQDALGISDLKAQVLFFPELYDGPEYDTIDRAWAARTLRHLAATGIVDWNATKETAE